LLVDGNVSELVYISMLLQRFGYNSCTATTGAQAVEMAITAVPALIITTLALPDMPGQELIERLKRDANTVAIPVIAKGGAAESGRELRRRETDVIAFLHDPVLAEDLFRTVQKALEITPRGNIRIRTRLQVVMNGKELDCGKGNCVTELSEYGMYIRTLELCPPNQRVSVQIKVGPRSIPIEAQVLYCHHSGEGPFKDPGMGLKFVSIDKSDREYLRAYVLEELIKGIDLVK
jgi:CheY-like chemotaxis protein